MPTGACTPAGSRIAVLPRSYRRVGGDLAGVGMDYPYGSTGVGAGRATPFSLSTRRSLSG